MQSAQRRDVADASAVCCRESYVRLRCGGRITLTISTPVQSGQTVACPKTTARYVRMTDKSRDDSRVLIEDLIGQLHQSLIRQREG